MHEHSLWEFIRIALVGFLAGGGGLRLASKFVRTMPKPLPGERWYEWLYDFAQSCCDNQDLRAPQDLQARVKAAGEQ
jgi:hypothetical protein